MRAFWIAPVIFALLNCAAPSTLRTSHDYDTKAYFSRMKTWAWLPASEAPQLNGHTPQANGHRAAVPSEINRARVRHAIENEMTRKGFQKSTSAVPDFYVVSHLLMGERIESDGIPEGYDYNRGYGWTGDLRVYDEGTLVIDVVRPSDKQLIWRGAGSDILDPTRTPEEREKVIGESVRAILEPFPPKTEKK